MTGGKDWTSEFNTMIEDCEARESRLTAWEAGFLDSLKAWIASGTRPTAKQEETLSNIWEAATSKVRR